MIENTAAPLDAKMQLSTIDRLDLTNTQRRLGMIVYDTDLGVYRQFINEPGTANTTETDWIDF